MNNWKRFLEEVDVLQINKEEIRKNVITNDYGIYPNSINTIDNIGFFIAREYSLKVMIVFGEAEDSFGFTGSKIVIGKYKVKVCNLTNENCKIIQSLFPFTKPTNHRGINITVGLGDRLGLASPGHIKLIENNNVFPILSQQSIRELNLTDRTYGDVMSAAAWAVFQEGYTSGFGADGDHLKTTDEIKMALDYGFTMITLDCSDHIDNKVSSLDIKEIDAQYQSIQKTEREQLENKYLGKEFKIADNTYVSYSIEEFKKVVLTYMKAVKYTIETYNNVIKKYSKLVDFEMSIDETLTSTSPGAHYFVASELIEGGVEITSLAPRFCGEFQKGIDYMGDIKQFEKEFTLHTEIAAHFNYKISVHSGSDKFSVFPIIGRVSKGKYHLKTAGTNWLEAIRVIALKSPDLYRKMHKFALENLDKAKKYYHISADVTKIPSVDNISDNDLPSLMDKDDSRQLMHITYGLILQDKDSSGKATFRDDIYDVLNKNEDAYNEALYKHIGRHLSDLQIKV